MRKARSVAFGLLALDSEATFVLPAEPYVIPREAGRPCCRRLLSRLSRVKVGRGPDPDTPGDACEDGGTTISVSTATELACRRAAVEARTARMSTQL